MSIGKINLFLLKLLNLFLALHQKRRTTLPSFLLARTEKGRCDCIASSFFLKPTDLNDWRRSPADPPRSRPSGRRRRCAVQAFWPLAKTLAQAEFTSAEHCNRRRVKAAKPKSKTKSSCFRNCFLFWGRQHNYNLRPDPLEAVTRRTVKNSKRTTPFGVVLRMVETTELESVTFRV